MKTIREEIEIACGQEEVFDLTQDYRQRLDWDPYLTEAYLLHGAEHADVGVDSYCKSRSGSVMVLRYISYNRPFVAAVSMVKGPKLLKRFNGAWNVRKIDNTHTLLQFTYHFELNGGPLGQLLLPFASHKFTKDMRQRLVAIKKHLEV